MNLPKRASPAFQLLLAVSAWAPYYNGTGPPPTTFPMYGLAGLPEDTILLFAGMATIDAAANLSVGYSCSFDVLPGGGSYSAPPETFANFPNDGVPRTGTQGVFLFPKDPTRIHAAGPINEWQTLDMIA